MQTIPINFSNSGKRIAKCGVLKLIAAENPTTGYHWRLKATGSINIHDEGFAAPTSNKFGAGGTHTFKVTANTSGTLTAEYVGPAKDVAATHLIEFRS